MSNRIYLFALIGLALVIAPAMAFDCFTCGDHHSGSCPDGLVCAVTGQDCHTVTDYGSCQLCPSHQEQVCVDYGYYTGQHHQTWHQVPVGQCPHGQDCICRDYDSQTVYDCHTSGYVSCDGPHHEKQILGTHQECQNNYACRACPEGQHKDGDNLCVPDVCGVDFCTEPGYHCEAGQCVENPPATFGGFLPSCFSDPVFGTLPASGPSCVAITGEPVIPLNSVDGERLYVTVTHNGQFCAEIIQHQGETEYSYAPDCSVPNYYHNDCDVQKICNPGTQATFTITGSRDFRVVAAPSLFTDDRPFTIQVINHFVDYSGASEGRVLDMHFQRKPDMQACRYWLNGVQQLPTTH